MKVKIPVALFLFALTVRLGYLHGLSTSPLFRIPIVDAKTYFEHAREIVEGGTNERSSPFWQPPLYPCFLAGIYGLFGEGAYPPRLIQMGIGAFSCVLIYWIGRRIFTERAGLLAGCIASICGVFLYFEGELLATTLAIFLDLAAVLALLRAADTPRWRGWLGAGLILGLAALTRPNILLFAPCAILWIWKLPHGRPRQAPPWARVLAFCLGLSLLISVVTVRNYLVGGEFILISSNAGINFYIGNNPDYDRTVAIRPGPDWEQLAGMPLTAGITEPAARSRFFLSKAWTFIRGHPLRYLRLMLKKLRLFWRADEIGRNSDLYYARRYSSVLSALLWKRGIGFPFGIIGPLSLLGMILCLSRWREVLLPLLFVLSYMASVVLFFVCARYRAPVLPFLILFAAYAVWWWIRRTGERQYRAVLGSLSLFLVLLFGANWGIGAMAADDPEVHYHLGYAYAGRGMYARAIAEYERALDGDPTHLSARNNLAAAYAQRGMYDRAISEYRRTLRISPDEPRIRYSLAGTYARCGRYREAIEEYLRVLELAPEGGMARTCFGLGHAYVKSGRVAEAIAAYERAVDADSSYVEAHYNLGIAYGWSGRQDDAASAYRTVLRRTPDHPGARINLGITYAQIGMPDRAIEELQRAIAFHPKNADAQYNLAVVYEESGGISEAISGYERALEIAPDHQRARDALVELRRQREAEGGRQ